MIRLALALWLAAGAAAAQGWPDLDRLLLSDLSLSGAAEASYWLPDTPDPATATRALGIVYEHIAGSAGNVAIATGLYVRGKQGWRFVGHISGVFGSSPRDPLFTPSHAEITTVMLGPNEPRCCPTQLTRWRIDLASRTAERLN